MKKEDENTMFKYLRGFEKFELEELKDVIDSKKWKMAQQSDIFKMAMKDFVNEIEEGKFESSDLAKKVFIDGKATIRDEENCLHNTCIETIEFLRGVLDMQGRYNPVNFIMLLSKIHTRLIKMKTIIEKCLLRYFIDIGEIEEYVQVRIKLSACINDLDCTLSFLKQENNI